MAENISYFIFKSLSAEEIEDLLKLINFNKSNITNLNTITQTVSTDNEFITQLKNSLTIKCGDSNF